MSIDWSQNERTTREIQVYTHYSAHAHGFGILLQFKAKQVNYLFYFYQERNPLSFVCNFNTRNKTTTYNGKTYWTVSGRVSEAYQFERNEKKIRAQ